MASTSSNSTVIWTNHGIPDLVCTQAHWSSLALFFLANYAAHCATIKFYPAETLKELVIAIASALLFPSSGLSRAIGAIRRRPRLRRLNKVQRAQMSGALCMVVRTVDWEPQAGEIIQNIRSNAPKKPDDLAVTPNAETRITNIPETQNLFSSSEKSLRQNDDILLLQLEENSPTRPDSMLLASSGIVNSAQQVSGPQASLSLTMPMQDQAGKSSELALQPTQDLKLIYSIYSPPWMKEWVTTDEPSDSIARRKCKIHGIYRLPKGYEFAFVPSDAIIAAIPVSGTERVSIELSTSNSLAKTGFSVVQTGYAAYSIYKARGDQITMYGYAAFGLTVIPYIMMSILNLIAQLLSDDYPMLYMIQSAEMDEATRRGGIFHGAVAKLEHWTGGIDNDTQRALINTNSGPWRVREVRKKRAIFENQETASPQHLQQIQIYKQNGQGISARGKLYIPNCSKFRRRGQVETSPLDSMTWRQYRVLRRRILDDKLFLHSFLWPLGLSLISFGILGVLSKFDKGAKSTSMERGFTMSWLVTGMLFGFLFPLLVYLWQSIVEVLVENFEPSCPGNIWQTIIDGIIWILLKLVVVLLALLLFIFCVPAIGGFVIVGKMILEYGSCSRV